MHSERGFLTLLGGKGATMVLAFVLAVSLSACDMSSQNIEYTSGSNLTVSGPESLALPDTVSSVTGEYYVRAFTINQDYSWSVSGSAEIIEVRRQGEFVDVEFSETGSFDVTVTTTIDGEEYSGTQTTGVAAP